MKTYLRDFFEEFSYPEEARAAFEQAYDIIAADAALESGFQALLQSYASDKNMDYDQAFKKMAEKASMNPRGIS